MTQLWTTDYEFDLFLLGFQSIDLTNVLCVHNQWFRFLLFTVTTTNQAITALKMLRENRNRFDLIISDVYMPDMDGFKLLELVGLEMDLPVISKLKPSNFTIILRIIK